MRRVLVTLTLLLSVLPVYGFSPGQQDTAPKISILNQDGQPTIHITDGDGIRIRIMFSQPAIQQEKITFALSDKSLNVGTCLITSGKVDCETQLFPSLGWHWDSDGVPQEARVILALNDQGEILGQSDPIAVSPRPVVMVHGFISNWQTWTNYLGPDGFLASLGLNGFAVGDGQVPGTLNTGQILSPRVRTNTIAQNAEILGQYIDGVKGKTGAQMVDLVVHSMGGMISRYYIDRLMQGRDVAQLIMLGSPMGGSDCAVLPAALGFFLPASVEIRQSYMTGVFNQQITHRRGVEFFDLGGTAINDAYKSPCADVPNDTVVSIESVNAIPLQSQRFDVIHSDLTSSQPVFDDFVRPLLQRSAGTFQPAPDLAPVAQTESPLEFTRVYIGHVDAGGSTGLTINIEPDINVASFALYDASRSITTIVRGASGNIIELDPQANGFIRIDDPASLFYLGYGFQNPRPGPWNITIQATNATPPDGTDFAISVYFVGGAQLEAESSTLVPQIGEQVQFNANLSLGGQSLEISEAHADIEDSDGNVETLDFPSGQNVSAAWTPNESGTDAVDIVVTGRAPDGSTIERTDFLAIEVQPNPGKGQITFNLVAVIAVAVLILFLVLFLIFRGARTVVRKARE